MVLCLFLLASFDRYIVGEFGAAGDTSQLLFLTAFGSAVLLTVRGIRSRLSRTNPRPEDRSAWDSAEYYSFLFSNVVVLLVAAILQPPWDGTPYCVVSIVFALPAALRKVKRLLE